MNSLYNETIHSKFMKFAACYPDKIALTFGTQTMTYKELDEKSDRAAGVLRQRGVKADTIVGLLFKRSFDMVIGILAVLKAGGAFLPIDPDFPDDRIDFMLKDSRCEILLSHMMLESRLKFDASRLYVDDIMKETSDMKLEDINSVHDLAYVIYTSGSTGVPKGVMVEHKAVVNFIKGITARIDFTSEKTILALTTIAFDISLMEILLPLTVGMRVVIADERQQKNPRLLKQAITSYGIDMLQMTPSRLQLLMYCDEDLSCLARIQELMIGGEAFPHVLLAKLQSTTKAKLYNMYGPTETTIWSTISELTDKKKVDIGKPILNTTIYIVDEDNRPTEHGIEGELCISGDGLARGYLYRPEQTLDRFINNPFEPYGKMYKTGDLARFLPDGNIECLGRMDEQIKIRGFRVELGEITACMEKYGAIKQAAVKTVEGKQGGKYLCAYYVAAEELDIGHLREYMKNFLPDYMLPEFFVKMDELPQTPNQKIDRKALPDPVNLKMG